MDVGHSWDLKGQEKFVCLITSYFYLHDQGFAL